MVFHDILDGCVFVRISHSNSKLIVNSSGISKMISVLSVQVYKTSHMDTTL